MITSVIFFASLGTLGLIKPTTSASINYEPIKITVNKNYYQPELEGQAEDIFSKSYINLPPGSIPSYIKFLISSIKQKTKSCSKETSVLVEKEVSEILKPLADPLPDFTKVPVLGIVSRKETITEIIKLLEDLLTELVAIPEEHSTSIEAVKPTITIVKKLELPPPPPPLSTPIIIEDEPNLITPKLSVLTETASMLPVSHDVSEKEINKETLLIENFVKISPGSLKSSADQLSDPNIVLEEIPPPLPFLRLDTNKIPEELRSPPPSQLIPILINDEPYPDSSEDDIILETPVLPQLSLNIIPSIAETRKTKEQVLLKPSAVSPPIQEISTVLRPDISSESKHVLPPSLPLPIPIRKKNESNLVIPEAPILPPLPLEMIPKIEEPVLLAESEVSLPIPEISTLQLPGTYLGSEELPPAPSLLQIPMKINNEPNLVTSKGLIIPEAPVLPPLSINIIPPIFENVVTKEPVLLEESEVSQEESKITVPGIGIVSELPSPLPSQPVLILNNDEPNYNDNEYPVTSKVGNIPEAPVLSPLLYDMIPSNTEKMKIEAQVLLEESKVPPPIQENSAILYGTEFEGLPPPPPPLPTALVKVNDEPNPVTLEVEIIPEAPILPPLSLDIIPTINEKVKIEEPVLGESEVSSPIQEISPILLVNTRKEPAKLPPTPPLPVPNVINNVANPITSQVVIIPEHPVLPPLSLDIIPPIVKVENEEPVFSGNSEVSRLIEENSMVLLPYTTTELQESPPPPPPALPILININEEPSPVTSESVTMLEAPVLPSLSFDVIPTFVEEVKNEEQILLGEPEVSRLIEEKSTVLLPYTNTKTEESMPPPPALPIQFKKNDEPNPVSSEDVIIPEAPVLPPLSLDVTPLFTEEVKIKEPIILEESEVSHQIKEISPILLPDTNLESEELPAPPPLLPISIKNDEPNFVTPENYIFPEAPVLPPLSLDIIPSIVEEVKNEKPIVANPKDLSPVNKDSIELGHTPTVEISSKPKLKPIAVSITKNSQVSKEVLQVTIPPKRRLIPSPFTNPKKRLKVFTNVPFLSHVSTGSLKSKAKKYIIPKLTSVEPISIERFNTNPQFPLPQAIFKSHPIIMMNRKSDKNNQFQLYTSCAHNIIEKRIAPYFAFKKRPRNSIKKY